LNRLLRLERVAVESHDLQPKSGQRAVERGATRHKWARPLTFFKTPTCAARTAHVQAARFSAHRRKASARSRNTVVLRSRSHRRRGAFTLVGRGGGTKELGS